MRAWIRFRTASEPVARTAAGLGLALAVLVGFGCASRQAGNYQTLRQDWSRAERTALRSAAGDDPLAGVPVLERSELVRLVLERNPSVESAHFAWRAALERYPQATAFDDPVVDVGVGPRTFGSASTHDAYMVGLRQPLPFPGKRGLRGERALARAEASRRNLEATRLELAVRAQGLFADYYLASRALEINAAQLRLVEELHQSALARYESGLASQQDPLQAETERLDLVHREIELRATLRIRAQQLNALLHRAVDAPLPPPPAKLSPEALPRAALAAAAERALDARPEIAAADALIAARKSARALARREFLPDFEVWGKYDRFWFERDLRPSVGVGLNFPLQIGRRRAALEEANAELERARRERARLADEIHAEVAGAVERVLEQQHLEELLSAQTLPTARDRVVAARAAYDTGQTGFDTLIDATRARLHAELSLETAVATLVRRQAELFGAAGDLGALQSGVRP